MIMERTFGRCNAHVRVTSVHSLRFCVASKSECHEIGIMGEIPSGRRLHPIEIFYQETVTTRSWTRKLKISKTLSHELLSTEVYNIIHIYLNLFWEFSFIKIYKHVCMFQIRSKLLYIKKRKLVKIFELLLNFKKKSITTYIWLKYKFMCPCFTCFTRVTRVT